MGFLKEFKQFAMRGNVIDLAVGVIIGGAFGKIVSSFVDDILMPSLGWLIGGIDFSNMKWTLGEVTINYGTFITTVVNFLIIAFAIFLLVRTLNKLQTKEEVQAPPPAPSNEEKLLAEIRDLLKTK